MSMPSILNEVKYTLWSPIKARIQEKKMNNEFEYYFGKAKSKGLNIETVADTNYVKKALAKKISDRKISIQPKKKGDLHIYYMTPFDYWERVNIPQALQKFGSVSTFYAHEHGFRILEHDYLVDWLSKRYSFNEALKKHFQETHARKKVDIVVSYLSGWHIFPDTIDFINNLGTVSISFWFDDKFKFRGRKADGLYEGAASVCANYDLNLTCVYNSVIKYFAEGGISLFWPEGANENNFYPLELPKIYDVSFIGSRYGARIEYINFLKKNNINVQAFGPGWENGLLPSDEMIRIYNQSTINLGFGGMGYSMKATCLKGRDFEIPMCGAVYLTSFDEDLHRVYDLEKDIFTYRSKEEMLEKIKYLLNNPSVCEKARKTARQKCLQEHTWEKRFQDVFKFIGVLNNE